MPRSSSYTSPLKEWHFWIAVGGFIIAATVAHFDAKTDLQGQIYSVQQNVAIYATTQKQIQRDIEDIKEDVRDIKRSIVKESDTHGEALAKR